jgi:hypothetical protein
MSRESTIGFTLCGVTRLEPLSLAHWRGLTLRKGFKRSNWLGPSLAQLQSASRLGELAQM